MKSKKIKPLKCFMVVSRFPDGSIFRAKKKYTRRHDAARRCTHPTDYIEEYDLVLVNEYIKISPKEFIARTEEAKLLYE